jgi:hypothetical protein
MRPKLFRYIVTYGNHFNHGVLVKESVSERFEVELINLLMEYLHLKREKM